MQTITIEILHHQAMKLLYDLELLQLIRVKREKLQQTTNVNWSARYKGSMTKQSPQEIDSQLNELHSEWD